ncbi:MAG: metallophosphoesterase family protein, partial [Terriglobia bacterium]
MEAGLVSDTHGYFDPRLRDLLRGTTAIIHAGDVGGRDTLEQLSQIAPVQAVKGNVDPPELGLPLTRVLHWEELRIEVVHILPATPAQVERWSRGGRLSPAEAGRRDRFLACFDPLTRAVIFGHTHQPCLLDLEGRLFINPGSAGKKRFSLPRCCAVITIAGGRVQ